MRARVLVPLFLCLFCSTAAFAQFNATIQGSVLDSSGAIVPNTKVTATNQETGRIYETVSSDTGFYRIGGLPPGKYTVTVEASGFKKYEAKDLVVSAEQPRGLDITLQLGTLAETVTVTAGTEGMQTESASISKSLTTNEILRLPQVGRDPYELARLAPGVFGDLARNGEGRSFGFPNGPGDPRSGGPGGSNTSIFQTENQVPISANGQRISANNYTIDGVSVNSQTWGGAAVVTPSQESVKEITVLSTSYSAEDGRNSGAQIKVVSQSGSNNFHGSAFYKHDDPGLNAFNHFPGSPKRVGNKLRQFGGSIGGPVLKDKLFFFFAYEGLRINNSQRFDRFVETSEYRNLIRSQRAGSVTATILGEPGIEPRIVQTLTPSCQNWINQSRPCAIVGTGLDIGSPTGATGQYVSLGNPGGGGLDGIPDLLFAEIAAPQTSRDHQFYANVDYNFGPNQFVASTYITRTNNEGGDVAAQGRPIADFASRRQNPIVFLSWIRTISSTMLNEARLNFTRFAFNEVDNNPSINFGIPRVEVEGLPITDRIRFGAPRADTTPGIFAENTFNFRDVFSRVQGRHGLKFGAEITWEQDNNNLLGGARPLYSFVGPWNLANGTPIFESINTDPRTGLGTDIQRYFRTRTLGFFAQDDWKVRRNLTLNLGLRYEYFTPLLEKNGRLTNLILGSGATALATARVAVLDRLFEPDRNNFAPRLGASWSPTRFNNKLVVRAGFGIYYNRIHEAMYANTRGNVPFFAHWDLCCGTASTDFGTPFANGTISYVLGTSNSVLSYPANPALTKGLDPNTNLPLSGRVEIWGTPAQMANAYVYGFSFEGDYELPYHLVATLGYQGSSSHKLIRIVNQNFIFDQTNPAIGPSFVPTPDVNANFHSLNTRLVRRYREGYEFSFSYRWSKSIDTLSNEGPGFATNQTFPRDLRQERGLSDYDATHYVLINWLWDIPILRDRNDWAGKAFGGWKLNGIFSFHSGFPWTPVSFANCLQFPGGNVLCPTRPIRMIKSPLDNHDTDSFLQPNGNFPGGGAQYFDTSASSPPGIGRNSFRGPRFSSFDLSIAKEFGLPNMAFFGEGARIDFRANFFNAFNKLNLAPFGFSTASTVVQDGRFGQGTEALAGRVVEFQARFSF